MATAAAAMAQQSAAFTTTTTLLKLVHTTKFIITVGTIVNC